MAELLTDLQRLYREAEEATETYNATEEKLKNKRAELTRLDSALSEARLSLHDSRGAAGRLARQQYQNSTDISPYVRLLLARDPQHALDQGHVIGQLARERAETVGRLTGTETPGRRTGPQRPGWRSTTSSPSPPRQKKDRDDVRDRLDDVEELLASLTAEQLTALAEFEKKGVDKAQQELHGVRRPGRGRPQCRPPRATEPCGTPYASWGSRTSGARRARRRTTARA